MRIDETDLRALGRLWGELGEFPTGQFDASLRHAFAGLSELLGAGNVTWLGARRDLTIAAGDPLSGWRPYSVRYQFQSGDKQKLLDEMTRREIQAPDPQTEANLRKTGATRAHLLSELIPPEEWKRSWIYNEFLRPQKVEDRLLGSFSLNETTEAHFCIDRGPREQPFGERERDLLLLFQLGGSGLHRDMLRGATLDQLTPRQRAVMQLLLTDMTEREIASELGLTPRTTHQYIVAILRRLGVKRRTGLMAHWLSAHRGNM